jgi:acyl-CoA thioester hydrolase
MGIVHHANYIKWFEIGRTDWLRKKGVTYRTVEEKGFFLPVLGVTCQYKKSAYYDDWITIKTEVSEYTGTRITFSYRVYRGEELLASGSTSHCWTNHQLKPLNLKKAWPELHHLLVQYRADRAN